MYKKILVALCIVISLFFIVPIIYYLWTRKSSGEPLVVKGPFIAIFLRNDYKTIHNSQLLYDAPDSEFVIDRSVIWNRPEVGQTASKKSIRFECHANVPVKWEYQGEGGLVSEARHHNKREIKDFQDPSTYWFETVLEFFNITEQITGKYICRAFDLSSASRFVYIYGKGEKTFITNEEVWSEVEPENEMIVSCPASDNNRTILLFEVIQPLDRTVSRQVDRNIIISFNHQMGFKLKPNKWGSYLCIDNDSNETSGIIRIFKPRRLIVKGEFLTKYSTNVPQNDSSLKVLCEAKEEITLNFINFATFKRRQVYFINESSEFKFTSRIKLRTEYFTNYSTVECATVKEGRTLRIWKFLKNEWSDKTTFRFDNISKGYECCTDNLETPRLTQATCFTQVECEMKKSCIKLDNKCPYIQILNQPIYEGKPGCVLAKVEKNPSGILECSYGNSSKSYLYFYSKRNGFHNFTSSDFRKKKVPVETMLQVVQRDSQIKFTQNDNVTFDCYGPKFFLANGFQWALKKWTGSIEYIFNESQPDEDSVEILHESLNIPLKELKSKTVTCIAPLLHSPHEWVNASTRFKNRLK